MKIQDGQQCLCITMATPWVSALPWLRHSLGVPLKKEYRKDMLQHRETLLHNRTEPALDFDLPVKTGGSAGEGLTRGPLSTALSNLHQDNPTGDNKL